MPVLTPTLTPPGFELEAQRTPIDAVGAVNRLDSASSNPTLVPQTGHSSSAELPSNSKSKIPSITLLSDVITDSMAARLGASLLGHVLFLKSQVPL